jgi:hypothetical protein
MKSQTRDRNLRRFAVILPTALTLLSAPESSLARTSVGQHGDVVVLQNEHVRIEYNLANGTYSARGRKDKSSNLTGACLQVDEFSSETSGLSRTWKSVPFKDDLGTGKKLMVQASGAGTPDLILEIALYDNRSFLALSGGLKNTLGQSIRVKEINPVHHAKAFDGVSPKFDVRMLNGPGGAASALGWTGSNRRLDCRPGSTAPPPWNARTTF